MMNQTTCLGWGYLVEEMGLKTWPKYWNGGGSRVILVTATPGAWFFEGLGCIMPDTKMPGFKHFTLRPGIVESVDWVTCSHNSPYGKIVSNWTRKNGRVMLHVEVPANSTATVYVPGRDPGKVREGGKPA